MMKKNIILAITLTTLIGVCFQGCITDEEPTNNDYNKENTLYVSMKKGVKANYSTIQEAIDAAPDNYTIYILKGHYKENIKINKTLHLVGEDPYTTIIDGNQSSDTIIIDAVHVNISNLTLMNSSTFANKAGIRIDKNHATIDHCIFKENTCGIYSNRAQYGSVHNCTFTKNKEYGVYAYAGSNYMKLYDNHFYSTECGLRIKGSRYCEVVRNQFNDSKKGMYFCCGAQQNMVYLNTFKNHSTWNADDQVGSNDWDDTVGHGNYWDDYNGIDADGDGIGDTRYELSSYRESYDNFPLMEPPV